jgi:UDP-2,4-diacetamido-2,4,6-trideoxy-beta-L-altropyranose hydrolase
MNRGTLLIRADANAAIGAGHVMRCLALAHGWQDAGGVAVVAAAELPVAIQERLIGENVEVVRLNVDPASDHDATELANLARQRGATWVAVDGARFGPGYFAALKKNSLKILWLDDFGSARAHDVDLILNQNHGATRDSYAWSRDESRLLVGTEYVTLRREFRQAKPRAETSGTARNVLVTFGGSDPDNLTELVLRALAADPPGVKVTAVVGGGNPRFSALRQLAASPGMTLLADSPNMPALMMESDIAVIAAGGTLWELLYCGCAVLSYSRNSVQADVIARLAAAGAVCDLGSASAFEPAALCEAIRRVAGSAAMRERMRAAGRQIVDGDGVSRVIRRLIGE